MDSVKWYSRKTTLLCILIVVLLNSLALNVYGSELAILAPNGGESIPSGSSYTIDWTAPPEMVSYKLQYSLNNGKIWKTIVKGITDTNYAWQVPTPTKNKNKCLVKIIGYDSFGKKVDVDKSNSPFKIDVMNITAPAGGEILPSGEYYGVTWDTNQTKQDVSKATCFYTKNGGETWKKIKTESGNPGFTLWQVPQVATSKKKCKVKVELKDVNGNIIGTDESNDYFTIEQYPFVFAEVIDTDNPILAVATDDIDDIGVLGDRDYSGSPIAVTGIVYLFEKGASGTVMVGMDGLPESVTDVSNNSVVFENYTQDTVDITQYNSIGTPVAGPVTVDITPEDLAKIKTLYTQALDDDSPSNCEAHNRLTNMLKYASHTSSWTGCVIYSAVGDLFNGSQGCFSALARNIAALTDKEAKNVFSFSLDGALCVADPVTCLAAFTDETAPRIGNCADIDGNWSGNEEVWIEATIDGKTVKDHYTGENGAIVISQEGCSVKWYLEGFLRKGKIDGNKLIGSGILIPEYSSVKFIKNKITYKGMVCGDEITLKGSGFAQGETYERGAWRNFTVEMKSTAKMFREE